MSGYATAGCIIGLLLAGACSGRQASDPAAPPQALEPGQTTAPDVELQQTGDGKVTIGEDTGSGEPDSPAQPE